MERLKTGMTKADEEEKGRLLEAVRQVYGSELVTFRKADYKLWASVKVRARKNELDDKVRQVKEIATKLGWQVYKETKRHRDWQRIYMVKDSPV